MSVFWVYFWLGVVGLSLTPWVADKIAGSGSERSGTHIWVTRGGKKVSDATVRDVWRRRHPGQSWDMHQESLRKNWMIILAIGYLAVLVWLVHGAYGLEWTLLVAPVLGGAAGMLFLTLHALAPEYRFSLLKYAHYGLASVVGVAAVGGLAYYWMGEDLPFEYKWIWVPVAGILAVPVLHRVAVHQAARRRAADKKRVAAAKVDSATSRGDDLMMWVGNVLYHGELGDTGGFAIAMEEAVERLQAGDYDSWVRDYAFVALTEDLMADQRERRPLVFRAPQLEEARSEILSALQAFHEYQSGR